MSLIHGTSRPWCCHGHSTATGEVSHSSCHQLRAYPRSSNSLGGVYHHRMLASLIHPVEKKIVSSSHFFLGLPGKELSLEHLGDAHAKDNYRNGISGNSKSNNCLWHEHLQGARD